MFGQQKGLAKSELDDYESAMKHYQTLIIKDEKSLPGDGAAGSLGFAIRTFLNGSSRSDFEFISEQTDLENLIKQVDLVVTGEGKMTIKVYKEKFPSALVRLPKNTIFLSSLLLEVSQEMSIFFKTEGFQ